MSNKTRASNSRKLLALVRDVTRSLPTSQDRFEIAAAINAVVEYLNDLKRTLESVPTLEDMTPLDEALANLDRHFARIQDNVLVARTLGTKKPMPSKPKPSFSANDESEAVLALKRLRTYTPDQIREELQDGTRFSLGVLRVLAGSLGAPVQARSSRAQLAAAVMTKLVNLRGYAYLSGEENAEETTALNLESLSDPLTENS